MPVNTVGRTFPGSTDRDERTADLQFGVREHHFGILALAVVNRSTPTEARRAGVPDMLGPKEDSEARKLWG